MCIRDSGYTVDATDLSPSMIAAAQVKPHPDSITFRVMDMLEMETKLPVQAIVCYCDSLNYLASLDQVAQFIQKAAALLKNSGVLLFDMHTQEPVSYTHLLFDFEASLLEGMNRHLFGKDVIVVGTKRDLLPETVGSEKLAKFVYGRLKELGIQVKGLVP